MSTINQLSEASAFSLSMQIPVYDSGNGQARKVSGQQLVDYLAANPAAPSAPVRLPSYTVAELSALLPASYPNRIVYCTNGASGSPCLAVSNGTSWLRVVFGVAVSAT